MRIYVGGEVPVAEYRMTGSDELGDEVSSWVGDRAAVLMANHGLLTVGGVIAFVLGATMLFDTPGSFLRVSWSVIVPAALLTAGFFAVVRVPAAREP